MSPRQHESRSAPLRRTNRRVRSFSGEENKPNAPNLFSDAGSTMDFGDRQTLADAMDCCINEIRFPTEDMDQIKALGIPVNLVRLFALFSSMLLCSHVCSSFSHMPALRCLFGNRYALGNGHGPVSARYRVTAPDSTPFKSKLPSRFLLSPSFLLLIKDFSFCRHCKPMHAKTLRRIQ